MGSYKLSNLYRERMQGVEARKCIRPEGILIPVPAHPKYLFCPSQDQLYSTKMAGIDYYALKRVNPTEWNEQFDGFCITESGTRYKLRADYLRTLKEPDMNPIQNSFSTDAADYKGKYLIGSISKNNGVFSMTQNPARQPTRDAAKHEAARLAKLDPSKMFVVLCVTDIASLQDIVWA